MDADAQGNVYFADPDNNMVFRLGRDGTITIVAGNGIKSFSGEGGPATKAALNTPTSVALDGHGNIYIADHGNYRVRVVTADGVITTVAGTGLYGVSGVDGHIAKNTAIYVTDVAADHSGNLYICDSDWARVYKVGTDGVLKIVAGGGSAIPSDGASATSVKLGQPEGIAVDSHGLLYVAETYAVPRRVWRVGMDGRLTKVAGGTGNDQDGILATDAFIGTTEDIAVDSAGNVYIAESSSNRIRRVGTDGIIRTVAGSKSAGFSGDNGPAIAALFTWPTGIAVDNSGVVYVGDTYNMRVRRVGLDGTISTVSGNGKYRYTNESAQAITAILGTLGGRSLWIAKGASTSPIMTKAEPFA